MPQRLCVNARRGVCEKCLCVRTRLNSESQFPYSVVYYYCFIFRHGVISPTRRRNESAALVLDFRADDVTKLMPENSSARSPPVARSQVRQETSQWVGGTAVPARNVASGEHMDGP